MKDQIIECLKEQLDCRLSVSTRWLVWDKDENCWNVYGQEYHQRVKLLAKTKHLDLALEHLVGEEDD